MNLPTQEQRAQWLAEAKASFEASPAVEDMSFDELIALLKDRAEEMPRVAFAAFMASRHHMPKRFIDAMATAADLPEWEEDEQNIVDLLFV